jgi:hypothetical protein
MHASVPSGYRLWIPRHYSRKCRDFNMCLYSTGRKPACLYTDDKATTLDAVRTAVRGYRLRS